MKNLLKMLIFLIAVIVHGSAQGQTPQLFSYQAVIRNASNQLLNNQQVGLRISILQGSESGSIIYSETHTPNTNQNGLISIQVGSGSIINGSISDVDWANGPYFIKSETDPNGGNSYSIFNISQLLSVPYALYAETSGSSIPGPQGAPGPVGPTGLTGASGPQGVQGPAGNNGKNTLVLTTSISAGGFCASGGIKIEYGLDLNNNSLLDINEINLTLTQYICNGQTGSEASDYQQLAVSESGDTLFLQSGGYVIIPGISGANTSTNATGFSSHSCAATNVHNTLKSYGAMVDQAGNTYKTIAIGEQVWMAENLNTSIYRNGDRIQYFTGDQLWSTTNEGAYSFYNNNSNFDCPYGKLYNWYSVVDSRNLCPTGWHMPTDSEWTTLVDFLGGEVEARGKLKSLGTEYWQTPNISATNESGFSGLPGGMKSGYNGAYDIINQFCYWWTSSEYDASNGMYRILIHNNTLLNRGYDTKRNGFSVRCIKD